MSISRNQGNVLLKKVVQDPILDSVLPFTGHVPNLLTIFNTFRTSADNATLDSYQEALALNGIIMLAPGSHSQYGIDSPTWDSLLLDFNNIYNIDNTEGANDNELIECDEMITRFSNACINNLLNIEDIAINEIIKYTGQGPIVKKTLHVLNNLSKKVTANWNTNSMTEDTLTMQAFDPIVSQYMGKVHPEAIYYGCDHELNESKFRKRAQNGLRACGRVPDRSIEMKINNNSHHIYLAEIKTAGKCKNHPDLVKLATMIKDCIDFALKQGYDRSTTHVIGLLQEGTRSTVYFLNSPSRCFYCYYQVSAFSLPSSTTEMLHLQHAIEGLEKCRRLTVSAAINLERGLGDGNDEDDDYRMTSKSPAHHA